MIESPDLANLALTTPLHLSQHAVYKNYIVQYETSVNERQKNTFWVFTSRSKEIQNAKTKVKAMLRDFRIRC